ncbi:hypothetical protein ASF30_10255 [Leifsonia sp. Leaf264]|nr:hypothetical protein ASF30_10255 [Leifsonia sp. Leaf264]
MHIFLTAVADQPRTPANPHMWVTKNTTLWKDLTMATTTASLLNEYGSALRGSWGGIDGRSEQTSLGWLAAAIDRYGNQELDEYTVADLRAQLDVCPEGAGHWTESCDSSCTQPSA